MSHTKAPWRTAQRPHTKGPPSADPQDSHLDYFHISAGDVGGDGWEISGYMRPDDARLIAAAPELFEALRVAVNLWDNYRIDSTEDERGAKAKALAVLAKASPVTECSICRREHGREIVHEAE